MTGAAAGGGGSLAVSTAASPPIDGGPTLPSLPEAKDVGDTVVLVASVWFIPFNLTTWSGP